ncbi:MAG: hypothetical protein ACYCOU_06675 [Sulfobacillus sp.]
MNWHSFSELLNSIFVADPTVGMDVKQVRSVVAGLGSSLGHWDVLPDGQSASIYAAPPALARLPRPGSPTAVLCGSRSPDTLAAVTGEGGKVGVTVQWVPQDHLNPYAATRIEVSADYHESITRLADALKIRFRQEPAAWTLAHACGSIPGFIQSLSWSTEADLNWPRRDFDPERLRFVPRATTMERDGLVLSAYENPAGWARQDRLWKGNQFAIVDRDWGRYAVLADRNINILRFHHVEGTVAVPRQVPLPGIPARALGLCSGCPPRLEAGIGLGFHVYTDVPEAISKIIGAKMGQHCDSPGDQSGGVAT